MALAKPSENRPSPLKSQLGRQLFVAPALLLDLDEICEGWAVSSYNVYKLVNTGKLTTVARPNRQRYYLLAEVEREFGERKHPPTPRKASGFEWEQLAA